MLMASMRPCLLRCSARVAPQRRLAVGLRAAGGHFDTYATASAPAPASDVPAVNMVSLVGVVAKKPWFQDFGTSQKASLNVDVKRRSSKQKTNEIKVVAWGGLAEYVTAYVQQGASVTLTGELVHNTWQDKTTEEWKSETIVVADKLQLYTPGQHPLLVEHAPAEYNGAPQYNASHQIIAPPRYSAPSQPDAPTQYGAPDGTPQQAPVASYQPQPQQLLLKQQHQQAGDPAPAAVQGPLTTVMKPNRHFPKMAAVYKEVTKNIYAFGEIAAGFNIQPYTALNYTVTHWELTGDPLDLGVVALVLDIGVVGDSYMELPALLDVIAEVYRESRTESATHHVSVRAVRDRLMSTRMAPTIEGQERMRGGPSLTYTQITFAESLYRRGVMSKEVEEAILNARAVLDQQQQQPQQQLQVQPL